MTRSDKYEPYSHQGRKVVEAIQPVSVTFGNQVIAKGNRKAIVQELLCKKDNAAFYHAGGALAHAFQRALNA
jgi:hypothetical protein